MEKIFKLIDDYKKELEKDYANISLEEVKSIQYGGKVSKFYIPIIPNILNSLIKELDLFKKELEYDIDLFNNYNLNPYEDLSYINEKEKDENKLWKEFGEYKKNLDIEKIENDYKEYYNKVKKENYIPRDLRIITELLEIREKNIKRHEEFIYNILLELSDKEDYFINCFRFSALDVDYRRLKNDFYYELLEDYPNVVKENYTHYML